jgi:hypothetical protein
VAAVQSSSVRLSSAHLLLIAVERVGPVGSGGIHAWVREWSRVTVAVVKRGSRVVHPVVPLVAVITPKL